MKNVLLIDADLNHLVVLAEALSDACYQVTARIDAESALAVLKEDDRFDLIIIDYEMPGLDALSFMGQVRELMTNARVVVLAKNGNVETYVKLMSLGVFVYMSKPVRARELKRSVEAALTYSVQTGLVRKCGY